MKYTLSQPPDLFASALYLGDLQQVAVNCLLSPCQPWQLSKVVSTKQAEVVVRVDMVQCKNQVNQCFATALERQVRERKQSTIQLTWRKTKGYVNFVYGN